MRESLEKPRLHEHGVPPEKVFLSVHDTVAAALGHGLRPALGRPSPDVRKMWPKHSGGQLL